MKLCRFGIHSWAPWKIIEQGRLLGKEKIVVGSFYTQETVCKHCGFTERVYRELI